MNLSDLDKATASLERQYIANITQSYKVALSDIKQRVSKIYERYGVDGALDIATMQKMAVRDQKEITRLNKLFAEIDEDLATLNRGRPQQLAGYLTDVHDVNYNGVAEKIGDLTGVSFSQINREAVYRTSVSELAKIGLQSNAQAVRINIHRSITNSIVQGEGIQKMARRLTADLEQNANNALRIARTETTRIMGEARQDVFEQTKAKGIKIEKQWLSASDDRTRESHVRLDGETVDVDRPFSNGLMYPGDQSGPAEEVINCRCTMITILPDFE